MTDLILLLQLRLWLSLKAALLAINEEPLCKGFEKSGSACQRCKTKLWEQGAGCMSSTAEIRYLPLFFMLEPSEAGKSAKSFEMRVRSVNLFFTVMRSSTLNIDLYAR